MLSMSPFIQSLIKCAQNENPDDSPDLVIAGTPIPSVTRRASLTLCTTADTVVLTHPPPGLDSVPFENQGPLIQEVLEKPSSKEDNLRMLLDLNGGICEVVTGVTLVYPVLEAPGYKIK